MREALELGTKTYNKTTINLFLLTATWIFQWIGSWKFDMSVPKDGNLDSKEDVTFGPCAFARKTRDFVSLTDVISWEAKTWYICGHSRNSLYSHKRQYT